MYSVYIYPFGIHTYIHACMHTCIHAYVRTYIHTYLHTYIYIYTYIYIDIYNDPKKPSISGTGRCIEKTRVAPYPRPSHSGLGFEGAGFRV